jgi:hypothetical protein
MVDSTNPPTFRSFLAWLADRETTQAHPAAIAAPERVRTAALDARNETLQALTEAGQGAGHTRLGRQEPLQLLAAASPGGDDQPPPELTTPRGFRVTLAYDEGGSASGSSLCVLVRCPPELIDKLQGQTAWLWNGSERFELGQFDVEGKAIGTLPAGIEITLTDFSQGRVKLEGPDSES